MSHKTFNKGGQRRTIDFPCGFKLQGHPNELGLKTKLHKKTCEHCKCVDAHTDLPAFNKTHGNANGWDGVRAGVKRVAQEDKMATATTNDGEGIEAKYGDLDDIVNWINKKNKE
jgi:hypothetical protein